MLFTPLNFNLCYYYKIKYFKIKVCIQVSEKSLKERKQKQEDWMHILKIRKMEYHLSLYI